jgi:hypothetical protein
MSLLQDLQTVLAPLNIPFESGVFSGKAPDEYIVAVPLIDTFDLHADNEPEVDVQEVRLSIYTKGSYTQAKNAVVRALLSAGITITARQYIGFEAESGYHHYNVDTADYYEMEE